VESPAPQYIEPARLYDVRFVADLVGVTPRTVYQSMVGSKKMPLPTPIKLGRSVRFSGQHIIEFLAAHGVVISPAVSAAASVAAPTKRGPGRPRKVGGPQTNRGGAA
jgi:predicted DNA-binding transcriptional regulator AlpA